MDDHKTQKMSINKSRFADYRCRGQVAIGFLVIMGFILILVTAVTQLGQLSQVKVETSNASDAGALAAASWIVSGQNEAALISGRMQEAIDMIQALFLVPFCPGQEQIDYANALWSSLERHPANIGECEMIRNPPGNPPPWEQIVEFKSENCGLNTYFAHLANGVMESAWNMGRREYLTAAINNMMIRFTSGEDVKGINSDLYEEIREVQEKLYNRAESASTIIGYLAWHNGRLDRAGEPVKDLFLYHAPTYAMDGYPINPPQLTMGGIRAEFSQYSRGYEDDIDCLDEELDLNPVGIMETATGPKADLTLHPGFPPSRPLAMDPSGLKEWQKIDLDVVLPLQDVNFVRCPGLICGAVEVLYTDRLDVEPASIGIANRPNPVAITVQVSHQVYTAEGWATDDFEEGGHEDNIPALLSIPAYPKVTSESTVEITSSQFIHPTVRDAQARITKVK